MIRKYLLVKTTPSKEQSHNLVKIPVFYDAYASAEHGLINEEHTSRHIEVDKASLRVYFGLTSFNDLSIINARGDSMLPTIIISLSASNLKGTTKRRANMCYSHR